MPPARHCGACRPHAGHQAIAARAPALAEQPPLTAGPVKLGGQQSGTDGVRLGRRHAGRVRLVPGSNPQATVACTGVQGRPIVRQTGEARIPLHQTASGGRSGALGLQPRSA